MFDDFPKSVWFRPVGRALIHQSGRSQCERTVNNIAVASDPAHVRGAPKKIFVPDIENIFHRRINAEQIATGGMQNSLRLSGRAAGIENVKRMLGIEGDGLTICADVFQLAMPPRVAPFPHATFIADPFENDPTFYRGTAPQR